MIFLPLPRKVLEMNTALSIKGGLLLAFITLIIFFSVYYLFKEDDYFMASIRANAFVITPLYAAFAVCITYWASKKYSGFPLSESFSLPFLTLCIGGISSLGLIFLFFNFWGQEGAQLLKEGMIRNWFERYKTEMVQEYGLSAYERRVTIINSSKLFNSWFFLLYLLLCGLYYFILSVLIALFFRKT